MANNKQIHNVAIVGTGVIGASWAALYLARGLNVTATDPAPDAEANLRRYIDAAWKDLTVIGLSKNAARDHLKFTTDLKAALADADLVQENGPERKDFKIKLFADMDAATRPDAIIASSSSGLTMSTMQSACKHPERCVIGHPFNPPHVVPLVEVVAGEKTTRCRRFGRCRVLGARTPLGSHGSESPVPSRWWSGRNSPLHGTSLGACRLVVERSRNDHRIQSSGEASDYRRRAKGSCQPLGRRTQP